MCVCIYIYRERDAVIWRWDLFFACERGVGRVGPLLQVFAILFRIIHHASEAAKVCCPLGLRANASSLSCLNSTNADVSGYMKLLECTCNDPSYSKLRNLLMRYIQACSGRPFGKGGCHWPLASPGRHTAKWPQEPSGIQMANFWTARWPGDLVLLRKTHNKRYHKWI